MIPEFIYGEFILEVDLDDLHSWIFEHYMDRKKEGYHLTGCLLCSCCKN